VTHSATHPAPPATQPTSRAVTLASATLLAATGGLLDAVVYLNHGHTFANAMTGNVIFAGIAAISHDWDQVLRHIIPILAFLAGVIAARILHALPIRKPALLVLAVEAATLAIVGLLPPAFPQLAFVGLVAFASAFQVTTFRHVGRFTYNSTFITGNLREIAEGAYDRLFARDPAHRYRGRARFLKLSLICIGFLVGAIAGAWAATHHPTHAILFAEPLLLAVLALTLANPQSASSPSRTQSP
jgi:uncharacterized membrane protein YoaK (UPF0700 family)